VDPEARTVGLGVTTADVDADIKVDASNGAADTKDAKVISDDMS